MELEVGPESRVPQGDPSPKAADVRESEDFDRGPHPRAVRTRRGEDLDDEFIRKAVDDDDRLRSL